MNPQKHAVRPHFTQTRSKAKMQTIRVSGKSSALHPARITDKLDLRQSGTGVISRTKVQTNTVLESHKAVTDYIRRKQLQPLALHAKKDAERKTVPGDSLVLFLSLCFSFTTYVFLS